MTYRLLNSAMMPAPGTYTMRRITPEEFAQTVLAAHGKNQLVSYIGYSQTAALISRMSGIEIPVNRDATPVENGDFLLIAKLAYRPADPKTKGEPVKEDFEFYLATYNERTDWE